MAGEYLTFYIVMTYVVAYGVSASGLQLPRSSMLGVCVSMLKEARGREQPLPLEPHVAYAPAVAG